MNEANDFPRKAGRGMAWMAALLVLGGLTWYFDGVLDRQENPNSRVAGEIVGDVRQVVLDANRHDHYVATAEINGSPVTVMVDTGATQVALSSELARQLDLPLGPTSLVSTANGIAEVRLTRLDSVRLGNIEVRDVSAMVVPNMDAPDVLLGMSFLRDLEMNHRDGRLILRQR